MAADGTPELALGDVTSPIFPRSTAKPMQALAMLRNGFEPCDSAELAIATASHLGEPEHVQMVKRLLDRFDLAEEQLRCPRDLPFPDYARAMAISRGGARRIYMNCSGKHAAMLATCVINGWSTTDYPDPDHPLQKSVITTIRELTGQDDVELGVDGCGLPIVPISLTSLARTFAAFTTAAENSPERRIVDAMRAHPHLLSGTAAADLQLMTATPGLVCKVGADGVHAGAFGDSPLMGRAFAFRIADGSNRARIPLTAAILQRMGIDSTAALDTLVETPVLGGDTVVGGIRVISGVV